MNLPCEALQLRAFQSDQYENKVFIRTKRSLLLADTSEDQVYYYS